MRQDLTTVVQELGGRICRMEWNFKQDHTQWSTEAAEVIKFS